MQAEFLSSDSINANFDKLFLFVNEMLMTSGGSLGWIL